MKQFINYKRSNTKWVLFTQAVLVIFKLISLALKKLPQWKILFSLVTGVHVYFYTMVQYERMFNFTGFSSISSYWRIQISNDENRFLIEWLNIWIFIFTMKWDFYHHHRMMIYTLFQRHVLEINWKYLPTIFPFLGGRFLPVTKKNNKCDAKL